MKITNKAHALIDDLEQLSERSPAEWPASDDLKTEVSIKLQQLLALLPKDMGVTNDGRDRFELERMASATTTMTTTSELLAAVSDIVGTIDCLIFLPRAKTIQ